MADTHAALVWDKVTERFYETGVDKGVVYPQNTAGIYPAGYAWNGLISVKDQPDGGDAKDVYANNKVYLKLRSKENAKGSIDAYTYPDPFAPCIGQIAVVAGVTIGQQNHTAFGLSYRTLIGNDTEGDKAGYKLHLVWGATAAPAEMDYETEDDDPEAITMSWSYECVGIDTEVTIGSKTEIKNIATMTIDSRTVDADKLAALEAILYGSTTADARLPLPSEVLTIIA